MDTKFSNNEKIFDDYMINNIMPNTIAKYIYLFNDEKSSYNAHFESALALFNGYENCRNTISKNVKTILKNNYKFIITNEKFPFLNN